MTRVNRDHADRCPGVLRPWIADDGAIVRLRLAGGVVTTAALHRLLDIAAEWGDGTVLLTKRTNLQVRGIAHHDGCVPVEFVEAVTEAGLLPSPSHELVRNLMASPLTGRVGGRADLRPVVDDLDARLCADPRLAGLAGRFLFVLDDGRGDLIERDLDLGLVALSATSAQLRVGTGHWGTTVALNHAAEALLDLARRFLASRGEAGPTAAWHVDELPGRGAELLDAPHTRDPSTLVASEDPPHHGPLVQDDGRTCEHVRVPDGLLTRTIAEPLLARAGREVVVTPWRSLLLPDLDPTGTDLL